MNSFYSVFSQPYHYAKSFTPSFLKNSVITVAKSATALGVYTSHCIWDTIIDLGQLLEVSNPATATTSAIAPAPRAALSTNSEEVGVLGAMSNFITNTWYEKDASNLGDSRNTINKHPGVKIALNLTELVKNVVVDTVICPLVGGTLVNIAEANTKGVIASKEAQYSTEASIENDKVSMFSVEDSGYEVITAIDSNTMSQLSEALYPLEQTVENSNEMQTKDTVAIFTKVTCAESSILQSCTEALSILAATEASLDHEVGIQGHINMSEDSAEAAA